MPPEKVTEFEPLPAQPTQVKTPDVVKVTGSALAVDAAMDIMPTNIAVIRDVFNKRAMFVLSPLNISFDSFRTLIEFDGSHFKS
jgi:hypothetical protein